MSRRAVAVAAAACLLLVCCSRESTQVAAPTGSPSAPGASELTEAAAEVVDFLRGVTRFDELEVAPVVTLRLAREGGGNVVELSRETLRDPLNWEVPSAGGGDGYSFVPPEGAGDLQLAEGRHFNCLEYDLSSRADVDPDLPHVGTRLSDPAGSCLNSWNVTFLFQPGTDPPILVGAVYDQWEW